MRPEQIKRLQEQRSQLAQALDKAPAPEAPQVREMISRIDRMLSAPSMRQPRPDPEGLQHITAVALSRGRELRIGSREVDGQTELHVRLYRRHASGAMERTQNGMRLEPGMVEGLIDALRTLQQHLPGKVSP